MTTTPYCPFPMIPGPTTLHPRVLAAMQQDYGSGQVDAAFLALYAKVGQALGTIMGTKNDVVLMTGEGMLALWGALKSCLLPGDKVLSIGTGVFGDGIGEMAASFGCQVEALSFPYNSTLENGDSLARIEEAIRRFQPKMITAVHCDTPSGTLNPLANLGALKKQYNVPLFYVDAVASTGGTPVLADAWNIDLLLVGSQKCLSAPPSMSIVGVSETAWDVMKTVNYQGYDALLPFKTIQADGRCPYTPYWHGVAALDAACTLLLEEGLEAVFTRHEQVAALCRNGLAEMGIGLFPAADAVAAPTATAALVPQGWTWPDWKQALRAEGLAVAGSFGPMANKVFRLGHMGMQADPALMQGALAAIGRVLEKKTK